MESLRNTATGTLVLLCVIGFALGGCTTLTAGMYGGYNIQGTVLGICDYRGKTLYKVTALGCRYKKGAKGVKNPDFIYPDFKYLLSNRDYRVGQHIKLMAVSRTLGYGLIFATCNGKTEGARLYIDHWLYSQGGY